MSAETCQSSKLPLLSARSSGFFFSYKKEALPLQVLWAFFDRFERVTEQIYLYEVLAY